MTHMMQLTQPTLDVSSFKQEEHVVCLSKSMEKSFLALNSRKAREAYIEAELVNGLAHQIRIIRQQRGWTQKQLASLLGTTQTTISRLEDPSYGRYTIRTLLALGRVFDVAFFVRYMPFSRFMSATWDTRPENFEAVAYENEAPSIRFFTETKNGAYETGVIVDAEIEEYMLLASTGEALGYRLFEEDIAGEYTDIFASAIVIGGNSQESYNTK